MIKNKNNYKRNFAKLTLIVASFVLLVSFSAITLEKAQITNFYNKPHPIVTTEAKPINTISYTPATTNEQKETDDIKNQLVESSNGAQNNSSITVSFSAATQDDVGGPVIVKAIIIGTNSGECNLTLSKEGLLKNYSAKVINLGTYYGCDGFSIPVSDLESGQWNAKLIVTKDNAIGSAEQTIEVKI